MDKWFSHVDGDVTHWSSFCLHFAVVFVWILGGSTFLFFDENIRLMKQPYPRNVWSESVDAWRWHKKVFESWIQTIVLFGDQVNFHFCEPSYVFFLMYWRYFSILLWTKWQNPINEMWRVKDILRSLKATLQTFSSVGFCEADLSPDFFSMSDQAQWWFFWMLWGFIGARGRCQGWNRQERWLHLRRLQRLIHSARKDGLNGYYSRKSQKGAKEPQDDEGKTWRCMFISRHGRTQILGFQPMRADDFRRIHWRDTTANEGRKALAGMAGKIPHDSCIWLQVREKGVAKRCVVLFSRLACPLEWWVHH